MKPFRLDTVKNQGKIALGLYFLKDYSLVLKVLAAAALLWLVLYLANVAIGLVAPVPECFKTCGQIGSTHCCLFKTPLLLRAAVSLAVIWVVSFAAHRRIKSNRLLFSVMLTGVFCFSALLYLLENGVGALASMGALVLIFLVLFYGYRDSLRR